MYFPRDESHPLSPHYEYLWKEVEDGFLWQHGNPSGITQELLCIKVELVSHSGLGHLQR
jgi:hypothetical protein